MADSKKYYVYDQPGYTHPYTVYNLKEDGVDSETQIQAAYFQDFFKRLNNIKNLHVKHDKGLNIKGSKKTLPDDYLITYGSNTNVDNLIPTQLLEYDPELLNIHSAISNLIANIPKLQKISKNTEYKDTSTIMDKNNINFNAFIEKPQYNILANNIRLLEEICAHNSDYSDWGDCCNSGSGGGDSGSGGGCGANSSYSPYFGGGSSTNGDYNSPSCNGNCDYTYCPCDYRNGNGKDNTSFSTVYK